MNEITRTKSKVQIWREQVEAQGRSGKTVREFCEEHQLKQHAFFYWKKKFGDLRRAHSRFVAVTRRVHRAAVLPRIHLPNGVRIELGEGLEAACVSRLILKICGVNDAKP